MRRLFYIVFLTLFTQASLAAQDTGFVNRSAMVAGDERHYQVYLPRDYDGAKTWPVILFLHGINERGADGLQQTQVGLGAAIRLYQDRWPAIVVFPQCPDEELWMGATGDIAMSALNETLSEFSGDESRVYLTGLSLGGNGTWYLGQKYPDRFAAMVPIAGWISGSEIMGIPSVIEGVNDPHSAVAQRVAATPVWIVHGAEDSAVEVAEARKMNNALKAEGAAVIYTELAGVGHNAWDWAYANAELISWLFSQRRGR